MGLTEAWQNCNPQQGPKPLSELQAFSFNVGLNTALLFVTANLISWLLSLFGIGAALITQIANWLGFIQSSTILMALLLELLFLAGYSASRLQIRFGDLDFSSLAGRHDGNIEVVVGRLTLAIPDGLRGREANFSVWPFQDGDYLYNIRPEPGRGMTLLTTQVGGAITNPNMNDFIVRTPGGAPASVLCNNNGQAFIHCEIDSARKWGGHVGAMLAIIALIILGIVFAPVLAALEAVCKVPVIGPALCFAAALLLGAIAALLGGSLGGLVGDGIDALNDPRDDVLEGDPAWARTHCF